MALMREKLTECKQEILQLRETLDIAFARGAKSTKAEEDRIVFPLLVACRDMVEEVLFAVSEDHGRLALRSVRTMYECVVFARYLSLHPEKTADYLATFHAQWATVLKNLPHAATAIPEVHSAISAKVPAYATGKYIDLDWSDKSTLDMAKDVAIPAEFHAWAFNYASGFVHPSAMFLVRHLSHGAGGALEISSQDQDEEAKSALQITHSLILNAVALRLKYAPSPQLEQQLSVCKNDYSRIWGYSPPI